MESYKRGSHTVWDCKYHIVWVTKYRFAILGGDVGQRCRELVRETARAHEMVIHAGSINRDHVHLLLSIPPSLSVSLAVQYLKGRSSHKLLAEFVSLRKRYWGQHLWARGYWVASSGDLLVFVYHCFDRIVIHGYLSGLSRPEQVVHFFRRVLGVPVISKEVLSQRTTDYQNWVEAFARNHDIPMEWAEKGVRKEDYVQPWLQKMVKKNAFGVYFVFKSMEQGPSFRVTVPKFPTKDPNHRILARQKSRFTHYYFYIRDEVLGPMVMRVATFFPFQTTYYLNGHNYIEQELNRAKVGIRKDDNAFLA